MSNVISKRRNELICQILVKCNVMEAAGTGFDKIMQEYNEADSMHRPFVYSSSDHFTLVLPDLTFEDGVLGGDSTVRLEAIAISNGTKYDQRVLELCYESAKKTSEIASFLKIADSSYLREKIIGNLVNSGYLVKTMRGRTAYFRTNHDLVCLIAMQ